MLAGSNFMGNRSACCARMSNHGHPAECLSIPRRITAAAVKTGQSERVVRIAP